MPSRTLSPQVNFGARVRELRQAAGITQEALAEHCGLFRTYLSRIENGTANPTLTMIHALATSLDVAVPVLFEPAAASTVRRPVDRAPAHSRGRVR